MTDCAPSNTGNKKSKLKKVGDAFNKLPKLLVFVFTLASQTSLAIISRLSKALQVLKLEGTESKKQGKTVYVLQAELHSGRLSWSENILSIN